MLPAFAERNKLSCRGAGLVGNPPPSLNDWFAEWAEGPRRRNRLRPGASFRNRPPASAACPLHVAAAVDAVLAAVCAGRLDELIAAARQLRDRERREAEAHNAELAERPEVPW